jgi:hypothetical protein
MLKNISKGTLALAVNAIFGLFKCFNEAPNQALSLYNNIPEEISKKLILSVAFKKLGSTLPHLLNRHLY